MLLFIFFSSVFCSLVHIYLSQLVNSPSWSIKLNSNTEEQAVREFITTSQSASEVPKKLEDVEEQAEQQGAQDGAKEEVKQEEEEEEQNDQQLEQVVQDGVTEEQEEQDITPEEQEDDRITGH